MTLWDLIPSEVGHRAALAICAIAFISGMAFDTAPRRPHESLKATSFSASPMAAVSSRDTPYMRASQSTPDDVEMPAGKIMSESTFFMTRKAPARPEIASMRLFS